MILVDIFVPSVDKIYDFQLSETTVINDVIEEIAEIIGKKEHSIIVGDVEKLQLCDKVKQCVLAKDRSLVECGVTTGSSLILI